MASISTISGANAPVRGNGKTLGLTDGTYYGGLATSGENNQAWQLCSGTAYYGSSLPNFAIGNIQSTDVFKNHLMGVTSDGSKSGMVVTFSGLTLGTIPSKKLGGFYIRY